MGILLTKILKPGLVLVVVTALCVCPLMMIGLILGITWPVLPRKYYSKLAAFLQNQFLLSFVWMYEGSHSSLNIFVSGDELPTQESALLVCNHVASHGDWAPAYSLIARLHGLGGFKCVVKDIAKWIPGFGWCMWLLNWPLLKRNWAGDKVYLQKKLQAYGKIDNVPLSLLIFPEGTRWTEKKHQAAVEYAKERKLHVPVHTMVPRYKGFQALVRGLDGVATHVYDITLAYKGFKVPKGSKGPGNFALFIQDLEKGATKCEFHIHVRRLKLNDLPKDDAKLKEMLFEWFAKKDELLKEFHASKDQKFKGSKKREPLQPSEWIPATSLMVVLASLFGHFCLYGFH